MAEPTLHRRLVFAFGAFAFLLALIFGGLVWGATHMAEDLLVRRFVEFELADYLERRARDVETPLPENRFLHSTLDVVQLPEALRAYENAADGIYEHTQPLQEKAEYHVSVHTLDSGARLYLYLDATQVEVLDDSTALMTWVALAGVLIVTLLGVALGRSTARRVMAPVVELADRVRHHDPNLVADFRRDLPDDEIGLLAHTLETSMNRARAFLDRERRFTRDASHELRSPVTVVLGAVELLEALPEASKPGFKRPIERIRRANDEMARLIESFLWLAREEALAEGATPRLLTVEAEGAVGRYRHLLAGKPVEVVVEIDACAEVEAPEGVLGIVLGNLIANAFHFVREGSVQIQGDEHHFAVIDSGPGIAKDRLDSVREAHQRGRESQGFGLGLAIVHDLCERFGWRLEIESQESQGTQVRVEFIVGRGVPVPRTPQD